MSVWVSAILSHNWESFSPKIIEEIAHAISKGTPTRKRRHPSFKSPEKEFAAEKTVQLFLPEDFTLMFGKKIICVEHTDRWSTFLTDNKSRNHFLSACKTIASLSGAKEILFLPEGTVLMDLYYGGDGFDDCKSKANRIWGPPDLDISRIYTTDEICQYSDKRVHYFLTNTV